MEGCDIPRRQKCDTDPQGQEAAAAVRARGPDSGRNTRGHGVSGQRHLQEAHAQSRSRDEGLTSHQAVSIPLGRKDSVLKRVHAWPAGRAFERSSSDLLAGDPRGAGRLLLSRPPPSRLPGTTRKRAQRIGDPLLNQSQGVVSKIGFQTSPSGI